MTNLQNNKSDKNPRRSFYQVEDDHRYGLESGEDDKVPLLNLIKKTNPDYVVEFGCGIEGFNQIHPDWIGVDISHYALSRNPGINCICGDWGEGLPIASNSIPFALSVFALEHVPNPESALEELDRVLAPGSYAYLHPAFNVPKWRASGLEYIDSSKLPLISKVNKLTLKIRNTLLWRFLTSLLWTRIYDEVRLFFSRRKKDNKLSLIWAKLTPYSGGFIGADSDAVCAIDKSAIAVWFISRGYQIMPDGGANTLLKRILAKHDALIIKKPM